jgi:uncharacterized membrane protein YesL
MGLIFQNYAKPGPGVGKEEAQKKTFIVFFETYFRNFWKLVGSGFAYVLCALPVLSYGLGSVGLTKVARNISRGKHSFGMSDFLETIAKNWKQALPAGIINALLTALIFFDLYFFFFNQEDNFSLIGLGVAMFVLITFSIMKYYMWLILITFRFSLWQIYKNSFKLTFLNLWKNLLLALALGLFYLLGYWVIVYGGELGTALVLIFAICFFPSFKFLMVQYVTFPCVRKFMIDPYYAEHPDDDIELRRSLGLLPEEETEEDDAVFSDEQILNDRSRTE